MSIAWPKWTVVCLFLASAVTASAQQSAPRDPPPAPPPVSSIPQQTTATYGDWVLRCQTTSNVEAPHLCEVVQTLQIEGKGPIAEIAVGRITSKVPLIVSVILPTNVSFPSSVQLSVDEKDTHPADLVWQRCLPAGCFANSEIKDDILRRWRLQTERGRLQFKEGDGRDIVLPFSFRGLSQALDALAKS